MNSSEAPGEGPGRETRLDEAVWEYKQLKQRGEAPPVEEWVARYPPELQEDLRADLRDLEDGGIGGVLPGPAAPPTPPPVLGDCELLGELGRGAMGVVYKAHQKGPNRLVALKMLLRGSGASPQQLERFRGEAKALGALDHPNIVSVYEVGEHQGQPFFAMELVEGGNLAERLAGRPQPPRAAAALLEVLARAVQAAHEKGVIHRDLKPSNVLLVEGPPTSLDKSTPKISDFGLARKLGEGAQTQDGILLGTPLYMAPEQAAGKGNEAGAAADVWALGAILYECLTGGPPFRAATEFDLLQAILVDDPLPVRRLQPKVPRDLETICLHCLHKEPGKRYASAQALADDLRRFLEDRPIKARPVRPWVRAWKWAKRHPARAGLAGALALLAAVLVAVAVAAILRARADKEEARRDRYLRHIALADRSLRASQPDLAESFLEQCPEDLRAWEWHYLKRLCRLEVVALEGHKARVRALAYSADGRRVVTASEDGTARIWDTGTGKVLRVLRGHRQEVTSACFLDEKGLQVATAGDDQVVRRWDTTTETELPPLGKGSLVASSPAKGMLAAVGREGPLVVWKRDGKGWQRWRTFEQRTIPLSLALSANGKYVATGGHENRLADLWRLEDRKKLKLEKPGPLIPARNGWALAFSPDEELLVAGGMQPVLWQVSSGKLVRSFPGMGSQNCSSLAFSPKLEGGRRLLAATFRDGLVRVWDVESGAIVRAPGRHGGTARGAQFSPDGEYLGVLRGKRVTLERLSPRPAPPSYELRGPGRLPFEALAFAPTDDGLPALAVRAGAEALLWGLATDKHDHLVPVARDRLAPPAGTAEPSNLVFAPTGLFVSGGWAGGLAGWGVDGRPSGAPLPPAANARRVAVSRGLWATTQGNNLVELWDGNGAPLHTFNAGACEVEALALSPNGRLLAACGSGGVRVWDTARPYRERADFGKQQHLLASVAFSPDSKRLATGGADTIVRLWDGRGRPLPGPLAELRGHLGPVSAVAFSPDGARLASASHDGTVRVWDMRTGQELLILTGHKGPVTDVAFSADGHLLATCGRDGAVRLWDGRPLGP
jgi:WD40 repeat protein